MDVETAPPLAKLWRGQRRIVATFTRDLDHPPEVVWRALIDPQILPQWLAPGSIELREGGAARLDFIDSGIVIDSKVSGCEPGRLIEYSWSTPGEPERPVCWIVEPAARGTRLTLKLSMPELEDVPRSCAGWDAHLDMLEATLEGVSIKFPFERFQAARQAYRIEIAGT